MKRTTKAALSLGGAGAAAAGLLVWLTAPGRAPREWKAPFLYRNFAHRGLYDPPWAYRKILWRPSRAAAGRGTGWSWTPGSPGTGRWWYPMTTTCGA